MARNAPGKHHRKGLSIVELMDLFPNDEEAERWFTKTRWPEGVRCPKCGCDNIQERATRKPQPYRCRGCRKDFSVKTDTLMHSSPLGFRIWVIAIFLATTNIKGIASMKQHRDLKVTQKTAWHLAHRIREAWNDEETMFAGPAESDSTFIGGKRKNMSKAKRKELREAGAGRGAVGKAEVVGVKDRSTGRIAARRAARSDIPHVAGFVAEKVRLGAKVYTDDAKVYGALGPWFDHEAVNHSVGEYVRQQAHTNGIESFWAMLKRGYQGVFHKFSEKHLDRYVVEFSGRHNIRNLDTIDMMRSLAVRMVGKRLRYRDLIADNGLPSGARGG
ncbi:MAG: IS1595 family transposase [Alphaproteobacteria bacterium]|nr:IS1595 family transposase [Alphaproteobacteria bacterium]